MTQEQIVKLIAGILLTIYSSWYTYSAYKKLIIGRANARVLFLLFIGLVLIFNSLYESYHS
jgi:hypothetical protein